MKLLGFFMIAAAAIAASLEYSKRVRKRLRESECFLEFIRHMRIQLGCFMRPPCDLGRGFSSCEIDGFVSGISDNGIRAAYESAESGLSLSPNEKDILRGLFSSVGSGYLEDELKRIDKAEDAFLREYNDFKARAAKDVKLVSALSATAAVGIFIIII